MDNESEISEKTERFWNYIEECLHITVPIHLKNILRLQDIDNPYILGNLTSQEITEVEEFVRTDAYKNQLPKDIDYRQYYEFYGSYDYNYASFKFSVKEKLILLATADFIKNQSKDIWKITQ